MLAAAMSPKDKPLVWMYGEVKSPPLSKLARLQAGFLLRLLQRGDKVSWRIVYRIDADAIVIAEVFSKKTGKTPKKIIEICKARLREYDNG